MIHQNQKGFTLVEIVMASFILILGMGIIGSIIASISTTNFYSSRHTQAVILAQNKIEELLNEGYASDDLNDGEYENPLNPVNSTGDDSGAFYQSWTIYDVDPIPRAKKIISTVQWRETYGTEGDDDTELKSVTLSAICIDQSN